MRFSGRALITAAAALAFAAGHLLGAPALAAASSNQVAIIEDDPHTLAHPARTLLTFRELGAQMVRVFVPWSAIAPRWHSTKEPKRFSATNPAAYPAGAWARWDAIDRDAERDGLSVDFVLTGAAPRWADGPGAPSVVATNPNRAWYPSASKFGQFVRAAGTRYSGSYPDPLNPGHTLPRVSVWSIWNEPNFGEDLAPEAIDGSSIPVAPVLYRKIVNAAWGALHATGHGRDTILIGETAARGISGGSTRRNPGGYPGTFGQTKPLVFVRTLYCVDNNYRELRGNAARQVGCPTTSAGSSRFRSQNPGLFNASGFGDHPYPGDDPPNHDSSSDPNFATLPKLPNLEAELDRLQRIYGGHDRMPIYNDEYGYITKPPDRGSFVSTSTAAYYLNWAEYLSWRSGRIASTAQYLLYDPAPSKALSDGGFSSGLLTRSGRSKPALAAYRMPLYLPVSTTRHGRALEVWGCVRPAHYATLDTGQPQSVRIQLQRGSRGSFTTIQHVKITSLRGYFDTHVVFPASGTVRLAWSYPAGAPLLRRGTIYSRHVQVTVG